MLNDFFDTWFACALLWTAWTSWVLLRAAFLGTERLGDIVCRHHPLYLLLGPAEPYLRTRLSLRLAAASLALGWVPILNIVMLLATLLVAVQVKRGRARMHRRRLENAGR